MLRNLTEQLSISAFTTQVMVMTIVWFAFNGLCFGYLPESLFVHQLALMTGFALGMLYANRRPFFVGLFLANTISFGILSFALAQPPVLRTTGLAIIITWALTVFYRWHTEPDNQNSPLQSQFLAKISHEIRTPMNAIMGLARLLKEAKLPTQEHYWSATLLRTSEGLMHLLNDLLDLSKLEAHKLTLAPVPFNLQQLAQESVELMGIRARSNGVRMLLDYHNDAPRFIVGDPGRIRQIIYNLCNNAMQHTDEGEIVCQINQVGTESGQPRLQIAVSDTGRGIAAQDLKKIFKPFSQADNSRTRTRGGTGLGLSICQELASLMGGDIHVSSIVGRGSRFWVTFLCELADDTEQQTTAWDNINLTDTSALVVDSNRTARSIITAHLKQWDIHVEEASCAEEAYHLIKARTTPYTFITMDNALQDMPGYRLAERLQKEQLGLDSIYIMITAVPNRSDGVEMAKRGFKAYITQPVWTSDLFGALAVTYQAKVKQLRLPMITRHWLREAMRPKGSTVQSQYLSGKKILLVEDNEVNCLLVNRFLSTWDINVMTVHNGREALQAFKSNTFDMILMDCEMPVMDGFEATKRIIEIETTLHKTHTPIVALTANSFEEDVKRCYEAGMDDFLSKPVQREDFLELFQNWWQKQKAC